ncbi:MAG: hypothetical protein IKP88_05445 [Lachnospiraceae bacterium]|nr:hypothetical protein [Clostridiales bacterium]MBR4342129.1 hypothetical protein [Lachnospiraceae bacterium]
MCILLSLLFGSGSSREEKRREQDRRQRREDLEEEYDEIDGIEDADY